VPNPSATKPASLLATSPGAPETIPGSWPPPWRESSTRTIREDHPTDGRGAVIALTDEGLRTIEAAAPAHVASVRRHFIDLLSEDQLRALAEIADTVLAHLAVADGGDARRDGERG